MFSKSVLFCKGKLPEDINKVFKNWFRLETGLVFQSDM
jgi:hypothetical protein